MAINIIETFDLCHTYNSNSPLSFKALDGINLTISKGEFTAIIGHTGSGKSTLIEHFNGLLKPTSGELIVNDKKITKAKKQKLQDLRKDVGMVFQFPEAQLFAPTVQQDIEFGPKNFGVESNERELRAKKYIKMVGLNLDYLERSPFELSGGEKRRVAIAGILALETAVIILDEPTAGLDPKGATQIMALIKQLNEEGKSIVVVTHNMDNVLENCTKLILLDNKKMVYQGTPMELFSNNHIMKLHKVERPTILSFIESYNFKKQKNIPSNITTLKELAKYL